MSMWVQAVGITTPEAGPVRSRARLGRVPGPLGPCSRAVIASIDGLAAESEAFVLGTVGGDPEIVLDPHGTLRRCVQSAFDPPGGTTIVSAGARTVVAGLLEACLGLSSSSTSVGLAYVDWSQARECIVTLRLSSVEGAVALEQPALRRYASVASRATHERWIAGALRLARSIETGASGTEVVLDPNARDGLAWTTVVGPMALDPVDPSRP